jgi:hypothetical protein
MVDRKWLVLQCGWVALTTEVFNLKEKNYGRFTIVPVFLRKKCLPNTLLNDSSA